MDRREVDRADRISSQPFHIAAHDVTLVLNRQAIGRCVHSVTKARSPWLNFSDQRIGRCRTGFACRQTYARGRAAPLRKARRDLPVVFSVISLPFYWRRLSANNLHAVVRINRYRALFTNMVFNNIPDLRAFSTLVDRGPAQRSDMSWKHRFFHQFSAVSSL